jgi:hypothetical protein
MRLGNALWVISDLMGLAMDESEEVSLYTRQWNKQCYVCHESFVPSSARNGHSRITLALEMLAQLASVQGVLYLH